MSIIIKFSRPGEYLKYHEWIYELYQSGNYENCARNIDYAHRKTIGKPHRTLYLTIFDAHQKLS